MLTANELRQIVDYNPETGAMVWKVNTGKKRMVGKQVGAIHKYPNGYANLVTSIRKHKYSVHRLAWLYVYGDWPSGDVDHINGLATDNRIANLRLASKTQNQGNKKMHKNNRSGFKGVYWCTQRKKWRASLRFNRRNIHIGFFAEPKDASAAYLSKAREVFGEFATDRKA